MSFYTNKSIRLVTRCLAILEMLQKVNNRIEDNRRSLRIYDAGNANHFMSFMYSRSFFEQQLEKNLAIRNRLVLYNLNTQAQATEETCKQAVKILEAA